MFVLFLHEILIVFILGDTLYLMACMKKLPNSTIQLISSAQVISSIFSAVKELVENAIDAEANYIEVKLEEFGLKKIEVSDNGCGIANGEEEYVAKAHYTSKLRDHNDLMNLKTLGFRGEAIHSLCSLSNLSFSTKTNSNDVGKCYTLDFNGEIITTKLCTREVGTTFCCENIFGNVPVRKQFYSSKQKCKDQLKKIEDLLISYGLILSDVHFVLKHNKSVIWQKAKTKSLRESFISIFGIKCFQQMSVSGQEDENKNKITLIAPKSDADDVICRNTHDRIFMSVNKRPVYLKQIGQILKTRCREGVRCLNNKYPVAVVDLEVSCSNIDVNINPNKTQVILENLSEIQDLLIAMLLKLYSKEESNDQQIQNHAITEPDEETTNATSANSGMHPKSDDSLSTASQVSQELLHAVSSTPIPNSHNEASRDLNNGNKQVSCPKEAVHTFNDSNAEFSFDLFEKQSENGIDGEINETYSCEGNKKLKDFMTCKSGLVAACSDNAVEQEERYSSKDADKNEAHIQQCVDQNSNNQTLKETLDSFVITERIIENSNGETDDNKKEIERHDNDINVIGDDGLNEREILHKPSNGSHIDGIKTKSCDQAIEHLLDDDDEFIFDVNLEENSNKSFQDLSLVQTKIDSWSRGTALVDPKTKSPLQPVQILYPQSSKRENSTTETIKRTEFKTKKPCKVSIKRKSPFRNFPIETNQNLQTEETLEFSLEEIKRFYSTPEESTKVNQDNHPNSFNVVGKLSALKSWILEREKKFYLLNPIRLNEKVLFNQLMKRHEISSEQLSKPIVLNESLVGGIKKCILLQELSWEKIPLENHSFICDKRITSNGFKIRCRKNIENNNTIYEITHMTTTVPSYGVHGIKEILEKIENQSSTKDNPNSLLENCRPKDVIAYFKAEAARLVKNELNSLTREDVRNLLERVKSDTLNDVCCLHERNVFYQMDIFIKRMQRENDWLKLDVNVTWLSTNRRRISIRS